jgi:hypothetical protein
VHVRVGSRAHERIVDLVGEEKDGMEVDTSEKMDVASGVGFLGEASEEGVAHQQLQLRPRWSRAYQRWTGTPREVSGRGTRRTRPSRLCTGGGGRA